MNLPWTPPFSKEHFLKKVWHQGLSVATRHLPQHPVGAAHLVQHLHPLCTAIARGLCQTKKNKHHIKIEPVGLHWSKENIFKWEIGEEVKTLTAAGLIFYETRHCFAWQGLHTDLKWVDLALKKIKFAQSGVFNHTTLMLKDVTG